MVYILSTILRKAFENHATMGQKTSPEDIWKTLMLFPEDYGYGALYNEVTRKLMTKIEFEHGGKEYDD